MAGMNTGYFTYLAHPDLIHFKGYDKVYREQMRYLCREARSCGIPLEVNMLGSWSGRNYPNPVFWELAAEEGCQVVIGCDAHAPEHLLREDTEKKLLAMIRHYGLPLLEKVPLRSIK
jgi:histidinol-phosphatase (PHP family)